jgi:RNA polymerase sigma factor (sigma-70 family)
MTSSRFLGDLFASEAPRLRRALRRFGPNVSPDTVRPNGIAPITAVPDPDLAGPAAPAPGPEEDEAESEEALLGRLDDALATLPTHLRETITLYMIDGVQQGEIARRLGVTERTVRRYVAEALARCHAVLRGER